MKIRAQKIADLRNSGKDSNKYTVSELKMLVNYKKQKHDPPIPTKKEDLLQLYSTYYLSSNPRRSPVCSPHTSDTEENDDFDEFAVV